MNAKWLIAALGALPMVLAGDLAAACVVDSSWTIALPPKDGSAVDNGLREVADDFRWALKEGAGIEVKIVENAGGELSAKTFFFGRGFAEKAGFDLAGYRAMDNAYAERNGGVYFFGNDLNGKRGQKGAGWQEAYIPSAKAALRFMNDVLGVRFLMPGRVGTDVPKIDRVEVKEGLFSRETPKFDFCYAPKYGLMYSLGNGTLYRGNWKSFGGHLWPQLVTPELFREHPEYFALVGGRRIYGQGGHRGSLCISHPAVRELIIRRMLEEYDSGSEVVQLAQMDGWNFCECEKCGMAGGLANSQTIANKVWAFHLGIAEEIAKLRPGKKVWIINYSATFDLPQGVKKLPENVIVEACHVSDAKFAEWRDVEVPGGFTAYVYLWGNYPFMGFTAKRSYQYSVDFVKMLLRNRVHGLYRCGYGELMGMEGPANWVFNRAVEDPELDVNAAVEEYCRRAYGPAAPEMRRFHDTLDKQLRGVNAWEGLDDTGAWAERPGDLKDAKPKNALDWIGFVYSPEVIKTMEASLKAAEAKTTDAKIRKRLELVRKEFDYAANLGRIALLFNAYKLMPSKATLNPVLDQLEWRNRFIDSLYDEKGRPKPFPGWPEIRFFGAQKEKATVRTNGRLRATIGAPLGWDVEALRRSEALPGATRKTTVVRYTEAVPAIGSDEWNRARWQDLGGIQGEKAAVKARWKMLAGADSLFLLVESDLPDDVKTVEFTEPDGKCWNEDSVDLVLSPNGTRTVRYHVIFNPGNSKPYDAAVGLITDPLDPYYGKEDPVWNGNWKIENVRRDGRWTALVTIPYSSVKTQGGIGSKWYLNVGRAVKKRNAKGFDLLLWNPDLETRSMSSADAMGFFRVER